METVSLTGKVSHWKRNNSIEVFVITRMYMNTSQIGTTFTIEIYRLVNLMLAATF